MGAEVDAILKTQIIAHAQVVRHNEFIECMLEYWFGIPDRIEAGGMVFEAR